MNNDLLARRRLLKSKLQNRRRVFAGWNSFSHPSITEIFTRAGLDFIGIDLEHSTISQEQTQRIIAAAQSNGCLALVRIASHNAEMARRALDSGADGLIVPMVETSQDVERTIAWSKYPPEGKRGFGVSRAQGYGFDFDDYVKNWNSTSILMVQIESVRAVENIKEILASPHVDGAMIGPYDISGSLGIPGQLTHEKVLKLCNEVNRECVRQKKSYGTHIVEPTVERIKKAFKAGYTFTVLGSDVFALWKWTQRLGEHVLALRQNAR